MITAVKAIIKKGDLILIVKRAPDDRAFPRHWDFPGGTVEENETPEIGIKREVLEETKLNLTDFKPFFELIRYQFGSDVKFIIYSTKYLGGEIVLSKEHTEFRWVTLEELKELKKEPYVVEMFKANPDLLF